MKTFFTTVDSCRVCPGEKLTPFFDLGLQPPANSLVPDENETIPSAPLQLAWSEAAHLVQLTVDVNPQYLFENYVWTTGTSATTRNYSEEFFRQTRDFACLKESGRILEIASNDGTFLRPFKNSGMAVLGVDPAQNIAEIANSAGIPTLPKFFNHKVSNQLKNEQGEFDVVIARNVLPHSPNVTDIVSGMQNLISPQGTVVIEFHHAGAIVTELHYDSIYHEHFFYYSLASICKIFKRFQLFPVHGFRSPISGGSFVVFFQSQAKPPTDELFELTTLDEAQRLGSFDVWKAFAEKSEAHANQFKQKLDALCQKHNTVVGYGASARSSTLLNYCNVNNSHLSCIIDQNPLKHHRYTAGSCIPILPPDEALAKRPDSIVLLAWNFEREILSELQERGYTGDVLIPLPGEPRILQLGS